MGLDLTVAGCDLEGQLMRRVRLMRQVRVVGQAGAVGQAPVVGRRRLIRGVRLARGARTLAGALLACAALLGPAALPALADTTASPSDGSDATSAASDEDAGPTEAGTSFRTAAAMQLDQQATASASTGDYLYWSFPADSGQRPTVQATVQLPTSPALHAASTWQIDVYDGLRRRQACMYGTQARTAATGTASVRLACTLRPVRAWAEPWANDPLPGTYYIRLTAVDLGSADVGLPFRASVKAASHDAGGAYAVGGSLSEPLVPGISMAAAAGSDSDSDSGTGDRASLAEGEPDGGWASGWATDRWIWTGVGGVLAALAGVGGYVLTRGRGPRYGPPPQG